MPPGPLFLLTTTSVRPLGLRNCLYGPTVAATAQVFVAGGATDDSLHVFFADCALCQALIAAWRVP